MKDKLLALLDRAYAPYSKFKVAAILEMSDGRLIPGVNVENASYGGTICAERNAITTAVALGYKKGEFKNLYIMVSGDKLSMPCFICRQVIIEFMEDNDKIILMDKDGNQKEYTVKECCPYPFDENDL